jgi:hypothetical protein
MFQSYVGILRSKLGLRRKEDEKTRQSEEKHEMKDSKPCLMVRGWKREGSKGESRMNGSYVGLSLFQTRFEVRLCYGMNNEKSEGKKDNFSLPRSSLRF